MIYPKSPETGMWLRINLLPIYLVLWPCFINTLNVNRRDSKDEHKQNQERICKISWQTNKTKQTNKTIYTKKLNDSPWKNVKQTTQTKQENRPDIFVKLKVNNVFLLKHSKLYSKWNIFLRKSARTLKPGADLVIIAKVSSILNNLSDLKFPREISEISPGNFRNFPGKFQIIVISNKSLYSGSTDYT